MHERTRFARRPAAWSLVSLLVVSILRPPVSSAGQAVAPAGDDPVRLDPARAVEREIGASETHAYTVETAAGQYFRVEVEQRGVDVAVRVVLPGGVEPPATDVVPGNDGSEAVSAVSAEGGTYRVEVRPAAPGLPLGRYRVVLRDLRTATAEDGKRSEADRLRAEGEILFRKGGATVTKAVEAFERSALLRRELGERAAELEARKRVGDAHLKAHARDAAITVYEDVMRRARETGDRKIEGAALSGIGLAHSEKGDRDEAIRLFEEARAIQRTAGDRFGEATTLSRLAMITSVKGEVEASLPLFLEALSIRREVGDRGGEAATLNNLAGAYVHLYRYAEAIDAYKRVLEIDESRGDTWNLAGTLHNLGLAYMRQGDVVNAVPAFEKAVETARIAKNIAQESLALNLLGVLSRGQGDFDRARERFRDAIARANEAGIPPHARTSLLNLGNMASSLGKMEEAMECYDALVALGENDPRAHALLGGIRLRQGNWREAIASFEKVLATLPARDETTLRQLALTGLGNAWRQLKDFDKVAQYLEAARHVSVNTLSDRAVVDRDLSQCELERGNLASARNLIEEAASFQDLIWRNARTQEQQFSQSAFVRSIYDTYVEVLMRLHATEPGAGYDAEALRASERGRARGLLDLLALSQVDVSVGVSPELVEKERAAETHLAGALEDQLRLTHKGGTPGELAAAAKTVAARKGALSEIQAQLRAESPAYAALTRPEPLGLREIQQRVLDSDTLLLEYALGTQRGYLFVVSASALKVYELPGWAVIEEAVLRTREGMTGEGTPEAFERASAELSKLVLGPAAADLGTSRLAIVADGSLQLVPFAALPEPGTGEPLVVRHEVVMLPSASAIVVQRDLLSGRKPASKAVAVLADPVFASDDERVLRALGRKGAPAAGAPENVEAHVRGDAFRRARAAWREKGLTREGELVRLPGTREEANRIMRLAPRDAGRAALDWEASERLARSVDIRQYRVLHFATHGYLEPSQPELSGLVLTLVNEKGEPEDGFLSVPEIFGLNLPAELVVLSGCETALGKDVRGEGLVGMTRAFMHAGSPRVVASLWSVRDKATTELMGRFYEGMFKRRLRSAAALREAQLATRRDPKWRSPRDWAAFVYTGEWR